MSNFVLKFSYQVNGNSSGSRLMDRGMNFVIMLQGWFLLNSVRAWARVYFPMCAGQNSQGLSLHKYNWIILDFQASSQRGNY